MALDFFADLIEEIAAENIRLLLAEVKGPERDMFYKAGLTEKLGHENFFITVEDAYDALNEHQKEDIGGIALQANVGRE